MMSTFLINNKPGFEEWKQYARHCIRNQISPSQIHWKERQEENNLNLFIADQANLDLAIQSENLTCFTVSRAFVEKAQVAICHSNPQRFDLLYRILWRLHHENAKLLSYITDPDIIKLETLIKAVRRDAYKIKAFLRFREVHFDNQEHFVSWYEPEHYTLELSLPFFQERFKNMRWSILTPYRTAHWNGEALTISEQVNPELYPNDDAIEAYWIQYYASIFNPARLKTKAMLNQMPKKYWKNMPETAQIEHLIKASTTQLNTMLSQQK
jgi:uracil-DNA glycosylase